MDYPTERRRRPGFEDDNTRIYGRQTIERRRECSRREAERIGREARAKHNHIDTVTHGAVLFVVTHTVFIGFNGFWAVAFAGTLVGHIWHRTQADKRLAGLMAGGVYLAVSLYTAGGSVRFVWFGLAAYIIAALSGFMARQRIAMAVGA